MSDNVQVRDFKSSSRCATRTGQTPKSDNDSDKPIVSDKDLNLNNE